MFEQGRMRSRSSASRSPIARFGVENTRRSPSLFIAVLLTPLRLSLGSSASHLRSKSKRATATIAVATPARMPSSETEVAKAPRGVAEEPLQAHYGAAALGGLRVADTKARSSTETTAHGLCDQQQAFAFRPLPHGQGSFRPTECQRSFASASNWAMTSLGPIFARPNSTIRLIYGAAYSKKATSPSQRTFNPISPSELTPKRSFGHPPLHALSHGHRRH